MLRIATNSQNEKQNDYVGFYMKTTRNNISAKRKGFTNKIAVSMTAIATTQKVETTANTTPVRSSSKVQLF